KCCSDSSQVDCEKNLKPFAPSLPFLSAKQPSRPQLCAKKSIQWARVIGAVAVLAPSPRLALSLSCLSTPAFMHEPSPITMISFNSAV
ncbi:hypothetical protein CTAM01_10700, partial [Colletotrichum tamarilloi]